MSDFIRVRRIPPRPRWFCLLCRRHAMVEAIQFEISPNGRCAIGRDVRYCLDHATELIGQPALEETS